MGGNKKKYPPSKYRVKKIVKSFPFDIFSFQDITEGWCDTAIRSNKYCYSATETDSQLKTKNFTTKTFVL